MSLIEETDFFFKQKTAYEIDSKYRLFILAAKRSKKFQGGARPRIDIDAVKHKNTRIALEEVMQGRVNFSKTNDVVEEKIVIYGISNLRSQIQPLQIFDLRFKFSDHNNPLTSPCNQARHRLQA